MPCYDPISESSVVYRDGPDPAVAAALREANRRNDKLQQRNDTLTDLLCKAGRAKYAATLIPPEVIQWWTEHCKFDQARGEPWPVTPPTVDRVNAELSSIFK